MNIIQFEDKPLAHYSYAIVSNGKMAIVDPTRNPEQYYLLAEKYNAKIIAIFETHPHADFVSSHLQLHNETGATIYTSKLVNANYPHNSFDDGDNLKMDGITFEAINTPGHSPDSITIIAKDEENNVAMFSGDTLFIGDVGRPDLREKAGNIKAKREELAKNMYHTIQNKFNNLPDDTVIYPTHGAGSLCGKNMSTDSSSTLKREREENWAFKGTSEDEFVTHILKDQPFIPSYFGYNVAINKNGAKNLKYNISKPLFRFKVDQLNNENTVLIDIRNQKVFKQNHLENAINIMANSENDKFETWLGSIIKPEEPFYVILDSIKNKEVILNRVAKIGYEKQLKGTLTLDNSNFSSTKILDINDFKNNPDNYTIIDIRNKSEIDNIKIFKNSISIPLNELRSSEGKVPLDKPIVVHCAGGYRSAIGSSILSKLIKSITIYDLSDYVNEFL
ncbi:MBL fold metallo-hydrolase [Cellulophaga baltica]|uniref:MBL fold metallo-hydrolase n=1 Tax=Cellulophaga TaxID=104264 RepID=UPI001C06FB9D|nr:MULTISPECIES: MBL fold metallo-hydrolase [Cellulophaga]MBU2995415.1 MBL fold metallo-hydrolase [Cellulophaga baltica]MDO6766809.1 MBL fold metallo-hydrolase [Cellulophaga sp. 1_MG-2023]